MTTIECLYHESGANCALEVRDKSGGTVTLAVGKIGNRMETVVNTHDLLTALGAVDKAEAFEAVSEARNTFERRAEQAEAAIARVEKVLHNHSCDGEDMTPFAQQIRAAITGKKPLPTEPGSVIIATEVAGQKGEWVLFYDTDCGTCPWYSTHYIDGCQWFCSDDITEWRPAKVVEA